MIPVTPNTLAIEQSREAQTLGDLAFMNNLIASLWLADDESADLFTLY